MIFKSAYLSRLKTLKFFIATFIIIGSVTADTTIVLAIPDVRFYGGNKIDVFDPDSQCEAVEGGSGVAGGTVKEWVWSYLLGKGLTQDQAAGLMGNMQVESGIVPTRHQNRSLDVWNDRGDQGNAWGLVQWDGGRRYSEDLIKGYKGGVLGKLVTDKPHLTKYVAKEYDPVHFPSGPYKDASQDDLKELTVFELDYMYTESTTIRNAIDGGGKEWDVMKQQPDIESATEFWMRSFERPGIPHLERRIQFAKELKTELSGFAASTANASEAGTCGGTEGDKFTATLFDYAWNTYKGLDINATPGWQRVIQEAPSKQRYIGGTAYPGIDCGGFVTNLLIDSGFEPNYNFAGNISKKAGNTINQMMWLQNNWEKVGEKGGKGGSFDVAELKPGAVAINTTHTYVYVGTIIDYKTPDGVKDFESVIASASWDERAPMAGKETIADPDFTWYQRK